MRKILTALFLLSLFISCNSNDTINEDEPITIVTQKKQQVIEGQIIKLNQKTGQVTIQKDGVITEYNNRTTTNNNTKKSWNDPKRECKLIVDADKFIDWMGEKSLSFCDIKIYTTNGNKVAIGTGDATFIISEQFQLSSLSECQVEALEYIIKSDPTDAISVECKN